MRTARPHAGPPASLSLTRAGGAPATSLSSLSATRAPATDEGQLNGNNLMAGGAATYGRWRDERRWRDEGGGDDVCGDGESARDGEARQPDGAAERRRCGEDRAEKTMWRRRFARRIYSTHPLVAVGEATRD
ncbi:hypothetical protein QYE76_005757 [Lolium multiflorum]|uniref:Uncharacterized protein n=1 Tax=Lolium multiflorum TaxID=4521 RepID=A0AAD8W1G9_LOLMU|nr:hypothetical protein QYE76_005757 [Lolium multiflorum]